MAEDFSDKVMKLIEKEFGDNIVVSGKQFMDKKQIIIPVSPALNIPLGGGIPEGTWTILAGKAKCGKMQPLYSKVLTPTGFKTIGELVVGEKVCSPNGSLSTIKNIYEHKDKTVYRVYFDDETYTDCGIEHLWLLRNKYKNWYIMSLEDIKDDLRYENDNRLKWRIPLLNSIKLEERKVSVHPYVMGCLIGDGGLTTNTIVLTNTDKDLLNKFSSLIPGYKLSSSPGSISYRVIMDYCGIPYREYLESYGIMGKKSHEKFIPEDYKYNSEENRLALIQGLMDTDGECSKTGLSSFTTVSEKLMSDFRELAESLGFKCKVVKRYTSCNGKKFPSFRCYVKGNDTSKLFSLERKKIRCKKRIKQELTRCISKVIAIGQEDCRCIELDSEDGLYITDNFIVTHNTSLALHIAKKAQQAKYGRKFTYILNVEGRIKKMNLEASGMDMDLVKIIGSTEDKIMSAQDYLNVGEKILMTHPGCILIIDSYSALCHEKEITDGIGTSTRGGGAMLLAQFCRQMANVVPVKKSVVIGITHLMANTSGYGAATQEKGGMAIAYQVDIKLRCKGVELWEGADKVKFGQKPTWVCECNALGAPPHQEATSLIRYGGGIDEISEHIEIATDLGLISKAGSYYTCDFMKNNLPILGVTTWDDTAKKMCKAQGQEKIYELLKSNPQWITVLENTMQKMLGA